MEIEEFLSTSYTSFHAIENCEKMLKEGGFQRLSLIEKWNLKCGGKYYVIKNQSANISFSIGKETFFNIAAAHADSPCLRVKGKQLIDSPAGKRLNVEQYGGLINYSMMDIPLVVAGRVMVNQNGHIESKLVCSKQNFVIPSLAIHQNREVNASLTLSVQNDMLPLVGEAKDAYEIVAPGENVIDADLFVVSAIKPFYSGNSGQFISSPRIDNLTSAWSVVRGICDSSAKGINVACVFDNEEIGSHTKQGADSNLLLSVLERICDNLSIDKEQFHIACEKGLLLSVDNAHAVHPAHLEKADKGGQVLLDKGIVIKHHTNYVSDAYGSAQIKLMLEESKIPYQDFYCNSDIRCGSTLGLFASSILHMNACDIGIGMFAMHSAIEMASHADIKKMHLCCKAFFERNFNGEN